MQEEKCSLLRDMILLGIVRYGEFTLSSGRKSNIYIDMREALAFPSLRKRLLALLAAEVGRIASHVDVIAGIATGGLPWATMLAEFFSKPLAYIRSEKKDYGRQRLVEGASVEGKTVLLVDDVATTGSSLLRGVEAIENNWGYVGYAVVVFDRMEGAREKLAEKRVQLLAPLDMGKLAECRPVNLSQ